MNWKIERQKTLVIPDIHQKVDWAQTVLDKENGNYERAVFLGDVFDSFHEPPKVADVKDCAIFLKNLINDERNIVLFGNHDFPYYETSYQHHKGYTIREVKHPCPGFTKSKTCKINKVITTEEWKKIRFFAVVNGFLLSHAGFRENNWYPFASDADAIDKLNAYCENEKDLAVLRQTPLFSCGFGRGGLNAYGGPLWMDWDCEFEDNLPYPQIVGHTPKFNTVRQIGKSFCLDGHQTCYAIIHEDGRVEFKSTEAKVEIINDDYFVLRRAVSTNPNLLSR